MCKPTDWFCLIIKFKIFESVDVGTMKHTNPVENLQLRTKLNQLLN